MTIDWGAFGAVFAVAILGTAALVGVFTLGVTALSKQEAAAALGRGTALARTGAYACFTLCTAAVVYGIYLIAG